MVQIETREAVDNTAAIAAVDGVNVVFISPMDLSKSLGFPGEVTHPVVQDALRQAEEAIRKSGKIMGTMLVPGFELGALIERGYDFIITGADIGILRSGMENQSKDYWKPPRRADAAKEWRTPTEECDTRRKGCIRRPMNRTWASP